jgi:hypothetical protein
MYNAIIRESNMIIIADCCQRKNLSAKLILKAEKSQRRTEVGNEPKKLNCLFLNKQEGYSTVF